MRMFSVYDVVGYIVVAILVTCCTFKFTYRMNGGSGSTLREFRRSVWLVLPGKVGKRARNTWVRKQVKFKYDIERKSNGRISFIECGDHETNRNILHDKSYDKYHKHYCQGRKMLLEAVLFGFFWPLLLAWIVIINVAEIICGVYRKVIPPST